MNILQINEMYKFGGASQIMEQLNQGLKQHGHNSYIVSGYNLKNVKQDKEDIILLRNDTMISLNKLFSTVGRRYAIPNLVVFFRLLYIIKKKQIDIVHFHAMQGDFISIREMGWISKFFPVVWTFHDVWTLTGGCGYFGNCLKWHNGDCKNCKNSFVQNKEASNYFRQKKKSFTKKQIQFVAPSRWMLEIMKKSFLKEEEMKGVYNGVNIDQFYPMDKRYIRQKYNIPLAKYYIVFIAADSSNRYKGFHHLKQALDQIKNPEDYMLLVVGNSKQIQSINQSFQIVHFGYIKEKEKLNEIYNMADVFILPSLQDNFPCVTLESMSAGTPVLAFQTGGIPEQIDDSCGWIVNEKSPEMLSEKINEIFQDKEVVEQKGKNARKRVEKYFQEDTMIQRYIKIYKKSIRK